MTRVLAALALLVLTSCERKDAPRAVAEPYDSAPVQAAVAPMASVSASSVASADIPEPPPMPPPPRKAPSAMAPPPAEPGPAVIFDEPTAYGGVTTKGSPSGAIAAPEGATSPKTASNVATLPKSPPDLCKGVAFPEEAEKDEATVTALVSVDATGHVTKVTIVHGGDQGFGRAARACILAATFTPALDDKGARIAANVTINVRFVR
jgi:TonB family protein